MELTLVLLTAIVWGISPIFDKVALKSVDPILTLSIRMMSSGVILFVYLLIVGKTKEIANISIKSISAILISAILSGVLGYTFYFKALSTGNVSKVVPLVATYPLFASIIAVLFLGESFTLTKFLGIAFIVFGIALINLR